MKNSFKTLILILAVLLPVSSFAQMQSHEVSATRIEIQDLRAKLIDLYEATLDSQARVLNSVQDFQDFKERSNSSWATFFGVREVVYSGSYRGIGLDSRDLDMVKKEAANIQKEINSRLVSLVSIDAEMATTLKLEMIQVEIVRLKNVINLQETRYKRAFSDFKKRQQENNASLFKKQIYISEFLGFNHYDSHVVKMAQDEIASLESQKSRMLTDLKAGIFVNISLGRFASCKSVL